MSKNAAGVDAEVPADSSYHSMQKKEIYLEYPFSAGRQKQLLIKELAEQWTAELKNILRPSSYACYQSNVEKYILPYIGEIPACSFNAAALSETLGILKQENGKEDGEEPFSRYTLYLLENIVRSMFHYGAENGLVPEISFGKAEYKIKNKKEAIPLSGLEMHQLLHVIDRQKKDMQLQILLPLYTGIGLSELCGLKWEDIDLESGKIHIHRNLVRVRQKTEKGQPVTTFAECELPENECRKFIIPEKLHVLLKTVYAEKRPEEESYVAEVDKKSGRKRNVSVVEIVKKENRGKDTAKVNVVLAEPPDSRTLQYRIKTVGEAAWIEELNFQRLRDTFAVMCLQAGGDVYSLAYIMGAGVPAVCDRYGQWMVRDDGFLKGIG